jgi:hypothetical protein
LQLLSSTHYSVGGCSIFGSRYSIDSMARMFSPRNDCED